MSPPIYLDGIPVNLEAAASDALEWLRWAKSPKRSAENDRRLDVMIATLEKFLDGVTPVYFGEKEPPTGIVKLEPEQ